MEPSCCLSIDIKLEDLLFQDRMPRKGREFFKALGINEARLCDLASGAVDLGNGWVKVFHRCSKLDDKNRCSIYKHRPQICRDWKCIDSKCNLCEED